MFLIAAISLGLLSSLHCVGMCGPIALALPVKNTTPSGHFTGILLYNLGRVFTYTLLGLLFGTIGQGFALAGWQNILSIALGSVILLYLFFPSFKFYRVSHGVVFNAINRLKSGIRKLFQQARPGSLFLIGVLNGLLPCGMVYLAIAGAIATGHTLTGALFMAAFGLGTLPAMISISVVGRYLSNHLRQKLRKVTPVFMGIMALLLIARGLNLGIPYLSPSVTTNDQGINVQSCCHK